MKEETRTQRRQQIEDAAYELLSEKGYAGASMLSIAKRARCSNETMYSWYGDKAGLFRSMIARNAEQARATLEAALSDGTTIRETLDRFGPLLLETVLSDKAVALNRAAAADPSGELGAAISAAGRETIRPLLTALFAPEKTAGALRFAKGVDPVELYLGLLIGDLQIRCIVARMPRPTAEALALRSQQAVLHLFALSDHTE